jgi:hypothetical protein
MQHVPLDRQDLSLRDGYPTDPTIAFGFAKEFIHDLPA